MKKRKKIKLAVTGSIGSGKSLFCEFLKQNGIPVINVDEASKELLESDKSIIEKIKITFGKESFVNGKPDKIFLAEKVFSNPENVKKINSIIHPKVIQKVNILADEILKDNNIAAAEAALIYEAKMEDYFDYVVLITAPEEVRMKRKMSSEKYSAEQFSKRNENQIPDEEKAQAADFVFDNNGSKDDLKNKASLLASILKGLIITNG